MEVWKYGRMEEPKTRPSCELVCGLWRSVYPALSWTTNLLRSLPAWPCENLVILGSQMKKIIWGLPSSCFFSRAQTATGMQVWGVLGDHVVCYWCKEDIHWSCPYNAGKLVHFLPSFPIGSGEVWIVWRKGFCWGFLEMELQLLQRRPWDTEQHFFLAEWRNCILYLLVLCWYETMGLHNHMLVLAYEIVW